jgi:radical SAM superfamily enzyme YgiQ (UPF0313 family)
MRYEGPIYRPPSEADSLLIQATVGCPHNRCTFCMVYKNGPGYKVRDVKDIKADILEARDRYGDRVRTLFFPAGNTIAMKTDDLCKIIVFAKETFPALQRITVYGSSQFIHRKGPKGLRRLAEAGLSRIHVGLESGDDVILKRIKKGTTGKEQIEAGRWTMEAGIELSLYVILGIGGKERTLPHAIETARVLNEIGPDFIRLRTFVPKISTQLLADVQNGSFQMLGPHEILRETAMLLKRTQVSSYLMSDHYTNYVNLEGKLPEEKKRLIGNIDRALKKDETMFRPFFIGME